MLCARRRRSRQAAHGAVRQRRLAGRRTRRNGRPRIAGTGVRVTGCPAARAMTFAHPAALVLTLLIVGLLLFVLRVLERRRSADALTYSNLDFLERAAASRIP